MLKVGLLGLGSIGTVHYDHAYKEIMATGGPVKVEACFDITKENLEKVEDVRKYTDLDSFFENEKGKLDMVDICLPTFMHKEVSIKAMEHGIHVLCEKPMALHYDDAVEMCRASQKTGKKLMIAQVLRFFKDFNIIRDYIENKKLGKLRNATSMSFGGGLPNGQNNWFRDSKLSGGPIFDIHVHIADLFVWLLGMPNYLTTISTEKIPNVGYNSFSTSLMYNDFYATISSDWGVSNNQHFKGRILRFNFENGYIINDSNGLAEVDMDGNITDLSSTQDTNPFAEEILYFAESIINNTNLDFCSPESTANTIRLIEAEIESADNGAKTFVF